MAADRGGPLVDAFEDAGRDPDKTVATTDGWVSEFEFEIGTRLAMDREESKRTSDRMLAVRAREAREGVPRIAGRRAYGWNYDMTEHVPEEVARTIHIGLDVDRWQSLRERAGLCCAVIFLNVLTGSGNRQVIQQREVVKAQHFYQAIGRLLFIVEC